jgi:glycosyltransferase involved in cell wall biosynthesis
MILSLIMAYYDNPTMLKKQFETIAGYPKPVRDCLEYIVVDDGSPRYPAKDVPSPVRSVALGLHGFSLFRIKVDVRWNQDAARNIGVHESKGDWLLLTDMDHLVPLNTMDRVMTMHLDPKLVYQFSRVSAPTMKWYKHHPNSWLMHRTMWDAIGGYDERFAGYYGTDGEFRERVWKHAYIEPLPFDLIRVPREVIADASTTTYARKTPTDKERIRSIATERNKEHGWKPRTLSFAYERVV